MIQRATPRSPKAHRSPEWPSPEDIRHRAAEIRANWSVAERARRRWLSQQFARNWQTMIESTEPCT